MLTKGLNGTRWGCGKPTANRKRRKQPRYPKQPCISTAGWLLMKSEYSLLLNNSVMLQEWRARLMGDIWQFKRWLWKGSSVLKEQKTGLDITQPLCWLFPENSSRARTLKLKEMVLWKSNVVFMAKLHSVVHTWTIIYMWKSIEFTLEKWDLATGKWIHICFASGVVWKWEGRGNPNSKQFSGERRKYFSAGNRWIQVHINCF